MVGVVVVAAAAVVVVGVVPAAGALRPTDSSQDFTIFTFMGFFQ